MKTRFDEDSRVKIPGIVHLTRLGYTYIPKKDWKNIDEETNIFKDKFKEGLSKINNKEYSEAEIKRFITEINNQLENDDMGKVFYKSLLSNFKCKLIDLDNFENNELSVVTELTCKNGEDEFRPDITILINGMPLIFAEVKKPNNREGILAERKRINDRFRNKKFKKFMNITQMLIFSNNNEYEEETTIPPIQGAFYGTPDTEDVKFNFFREEDNTITKYVKELNKEVEKIILLDNNLVSIINTPEYNTNKDINSPTNKIFTSLLSVDRIKTILKYGFAYVNVVDDEKNKIEKHIMRYPQFFATLAIEKKLNDEIKKGIVWHTQGSGKTALSYHNVFYLRDYYQKQNKIAKFYFITDRLDLATQAKGEFESRGLKVELVNSKEDFIKNIKTQGSSTSSSGQQTISVVNIQKFSEESISKTGDYNLNVQRVYFLDEVHRSYNPKGSFLTNLIKSDRDAVLIGLTGTPIISKDYKSKEIFGDYFHKYYYNKSISDGYTLRLIREEIETKFRNELQEVLNALEIEKGKIKKKEVFMHPRFVKPLTKYILDDFKKSRIINNDSSIGAMIVCDSSEQAKEIFEQVKEYNKGKLSSVAEKLVNYSGNKYIMATETPATYLKSNNEPLKAALILHDIDDKDTRKDNQLAFKRGEIDLLIVYNMLLTGFDAKRLKKLYLARVVKEHNLLQTLTRVNRPYKKFKYGYVVDFADIKKEFDKTNQRYFEELRSEIGDEVENYSKLFKSVEEIEKEIEEIKDKLFYYDFSNLEEFQKTISDITDKKELLDLRRVLDNLKILYNNIQYSDFKELKDKFPFDIVNRLLSEVSNRISIMNLKDNVDNETDNTQILNIALESLDFNFRKISEHEMKIADEFRDQLERTRKELNNNFDHKDPEFISLFEELKRIFKKKSIEELTSDEMETVNKELSSIYKRAHSLNNKDLFLSQKYENDAKFARIHKRLKELNSDVLKTDTKIFKILLNIKHETDLKILNNQDIINSQEFFLEDSKSTIITTLEENGIRNLETANFITNNLVEEYFGERAAY